MNRRPGKTVMKFTEAIKSVGRGSEDLQYSPAAWLDSAMAGSWPRSFCNAELVAIGHNRVFSKMRK